MTDPIRPSPSASVGLELNSRSDEVRWAESAADFEAPMPARDHLRRACDRPIFRFLDIGDAALRLLGARRPLGPGVHFIYLHHVFPEETGPFRELLARLSRESALIGHSEAAKLVSSGAIDRSYVSVSFDDGLLNCVEAARILQEFGASGCFFVCPGVVERSPDGAWIADWCRSALDRAPARVMGWAELERLQAMGHEIGNHTMHHVNIAATPRSQRMAEIHAARELLVRRLGDQAGRHFAWPFGHAQHIDEHALQEIHASGHATCSSAVRGVHLPGPSMERTPILLRHLVSFHRPVSSTGLFMRRSVRTCASAFNLGVR